MMKNVILLLSLVGFACFGAKADAFSDIKQNPAISASNHHVYPADSVLPQLTQAPEGYKPFYLGHYGRHGSRWLCGRGEYDHPVNCMERYDRAGKLTPLGKEVLDKLHLIQADAHGRWGELTEIGAKQHQGIGRRMTEHFPEIFSSDDKHIQAISSVVNRCILSMTNETQMIQAFNPQLDIRTDASQNYMWLVAQGPNGVLNTYRSQAQKDSETFRRENTHPERFVASLIADPIYARDSVDGYDIMRAIFHVAGIQQNHTNGIDLYYLFNPQEIYDIWKTENASHYVDYSEAPQSGDVMTFCQTHLLNDIIAQADSAVAGGSCSANLRFGHEVFFLPLACLMELDNTTEKIEDWEAIGESWRSYRLFPMACNIQMILYRTENPSDEVLVKVLLNEHEAKLPVEPFSGPYYRWSDLRNYYMTKLDRFKNEHPDCMPRTENVKIWL